MKAWLLGSVLALLALGCRSGSPERAVPSPAPADASPAPDAWKRFGAPLGAAAREPLKDVLSRPHDFDGKTIGLSGHVRRACSRRGCWMELAASADPSSPSCRVTFKDYAFFVPTDSAGSSAKLEGTLSVRRVEPKLVRHLEAEGASFPSKGADGSAEELRFVATGVELLRPPA